MTGIRNLKAGLDQRGGALREAQPNVGVEWFGRNSERLRRLREKADEIVAEARGREGNLRAKWGHEVREADRVYGRPNPNSSLGAERRGALGAAKRRHADEVSALLGDASQQLTKISDEMGTILGGAQSIRDRHLTVRAALRRAKHGHGGRILDPTESAAYRVAALGTFAAIGPREFVEQLQVAIDDGDLIGIGAACAQLELRDDVDVVDSEVLACVEVPGLAEKLHQVDTMLVEGEAFVATRDALASDRDRPALGAGRAHLEQGLVAGADRFKAIFSAMKRLDEMRPDEMRDLSDEPPADGAGDDEPTGAARLVEALTEKQ